MTAPWKVQLDIVANGMEAVEAARHEDYDLIFLDYLMPEVNGLEAGAEIRKYSQVPLVLLTASDQEDILRAVKDKGFDAFLGKPIDMFRFKNTLEELLPKEKQTPVVLRDNAGQAHHIEIYARAWKNCGRNYQSMLRRTGNFSVPRCMVSRVPADRSRRNISANMRKF